MQHETDISGAFACRAFLVVLPFKLRRLHVAVPTTEARSRRKAIQVALAMIASAVGDTDDFETGPLVGSPIAVSDTEENRTKYGITTEGYPESDIYSRSEWYMETTPARCGTCGKIVEKGRHCREHRFLKAA